MTLSITKSVRKYGYIIWNKAKNQDVVTLIGTRDTVKVNLNGLDLGEKNVDWKYYRISLGHRLTLALPEDHNMFSLNFKNDVLEVVSFHA